MSGSPSRTVMIAPITNSRPPMSPATGIDDRLISASGSANWRELTWMTRVPAPQGDRHDRAAADRRQHEPAEHRPDRGEQRHGQQRQQRVGRASARARVTVVPHRSAIASAMPSPITATANQPKSGRIAAKSASASTSSRFPPYLPVTNVVTGLPIGADGTMNGAARTSRANAA